MMTKSDLIGLFGGILLAVTMGVAAWPTLAQGMAEPARSGLDDPATSTSRRHDKLTSVQGLGGGSPQVVPAAAFGSDGFLPNTHHFWFDRGYVEGTDANYGCIEAPVYLPNGVRITKLFTSVYDNDTSYGIIVSLWRVDNFDGSTHLMAQGLTTEEGAYDGIQILGDLSVDEAEVVYPHYSHYVTACLQSDDIRLYSVRLYFTDQIVYLPLTIK